MALSLDCVKSRDRRPPQKKALLYYEISKTLMVTERKFVLGDERLEENTWRNVFIPAEKENRNMRALVVKISGEFISPFSIE